ncbi:MAG: hypothetical protein U5R14_07700 [Gemmatimonadota bacterium]|nr:hypothetical protein [Gemmatimonadota bacterium]
MKTALQRRFGRPRLRDLKRIAIDEISIEGGHRDLTIVLDLECGAVVFDRFHLVKLMNDKFSDLRRALQR